MKLTHYHFWRSSAAYRLRIVLNYLGLDYDQVPVDLISGENRQAENIARNPQGLVPTLDVDGNLLTQSLAIIEYLNEVQNSDLLPDDALGRARVRALSYAVAMEIHPVCNSSVAKFASESSNGELRVEDWMEHFLPKGLKAIEVMLNTPRTGVFCHGDRMSMADICLVPQWTNARRWDVDLDAYPTIARIVEHMETLDFVKAAQPAKHK